MEQSYSNQKIIIIKQHRTRRETRMPCFFLLSTNKVLFDGHFLIFLFI